VFLRKIEKGKAEKSFGIHVAKLAGLPESVLNKATEILHELENKALKQEQRQIGLWEFSETQITRNENRVIPSIVEESRLDSSQEAEDVEKREGAEIEKRAKSTNPLSPPYHGEEEMDSPLHENDTRASHQPETSNQLTSNQSLIEDLKTLDINNLTPLEALQKLNEIKSKL
jgi:DNA mismatch repair ATPase MutS